MLPIGVPALCRSAATVANCVAAASSQGRQRTRLRNCSTTWASRWAPSLSFRPCSSSPRVTAEMHTCSGGTAPMRAPAGRGAEWRGLDAWYGDLLQRMNAYDGINRAPVASDDAVHMKEAEDDAFWSAGLAAPGAAKAKAHEAGIYQSQGSLASARRQFRTVSWSWCRTGELARLVCKLHGWPRRRTASEKGSPYMSNLKCRDTYSGKQSGEAFERAKAARMPSGLFRAQINIAHARDPVWVQRGGWSAQQVRRIIRENLVIIGRANQLEVTWPPKNVSLAEWFNASKENGNDDDDEGAVRA